MPVLALIIATVAPVLVSVAQVIDAKGIQESLVWVGLYVGPLDGQLGPASLSAIQNFQRSINHPPTGALTGEETQLLIRRAVDRRNESGFKYVVDGTVGAFVGFPTALVQATRNSEFGSDYLSSDRNILIGIRHYNSNSSIENVYEGLRRALAATSIGYSVQRPDWFVISGETTDKKYYFRFFKVSAGYQGLVVAYDKSQSARLSPALTMLSLTFQPATVPVDPRFKSAPAVATIPLDANISNLLAVSEISKTNESSTQAKSSDRSGASAEAPPLQKSDRKVRSVDESKLLLDSVQEFLKSKSADRVRFYKYLVDKRHLKGFNSDMPVLRIVFEERVFFDTDKSDIRPEATPILNSIAESLRQRSGQAALFVAGHADSRGGEKYNIDLSVRRAESVAKSLSSKGVGSALIWRVGFGKSVPLRPNTTEENMAYNRRVEFLLATQPVVITAWIENNGSLCEDGTPDCGVQVGSSKFDVIPVAGSKAKPLSIQIPTQTPIEIDVHHRLIEVGPPLQ